MIIKECNQVFGFSVVGSISSETPLFASFAREIAPACMLARQARSVRIQERLSLDLLDRRYTISYPGHMVAVGSTGSDFYARHS